MTSHPWRAATTVAARRAATGVLAAAGDPVAAWLWGGGRSDVYATYERIRARGPLVVSPTGLRAVTSRALCEEVLRHPDMGVRLPGDRELAVDPLATGMSATISRSFLSLDAPDHARLRRVAAPTFRPKVVRSWAPRVAALAETMADDLARDLADGGVDSVDLVAAFAARFPVAVIGEVMGVGGVDAERFAAIGALVGTALDGVRTPAEAQRLRAAGAELEVMFSRLLDERAAEPREDALSVIAAARAQGRADTADALGIAGLLLIAGFETTVNLVGNAVAALQGGGPGGSRERWRELVDEPDLAPAVVEEALRHEPSVQNTARIAHVDVEIAGRTVPAGTPVLVVIAAGNRDPEAYARPAVFDPHRSGEPDHLAFSSGEHYCLGAPLARMEGDAALRALVRAVPDLVLAPGARHRRGRILRGYERLPVASAGGAARPRVSRDGDMR